MSTILDAEEFDAASLPPTLGALMPHVITLSKPRFEVVSGISLHNNRTTPMPQRPEGILSTVSARPQRFHKLGGPEVLKIEDAPFRQPFPLISALQKGLSIRGYWLAEIVTNPDRLARAKSYVYDRVKTGQLRPKIAKTFRFEDVVNAYQYMESN